MTDTVTTPVSGFVLPPSVVSKADVSRLVRELEQIDNELTAATVRSKAGVSVTAQPTSSERLSDFLTLNKLSLENTIERTELIKKLQTFKDNAPIIHMTFAVEADAESLGRIVQWLRESVHPQAVVAVGLQPGLVAGVYLRTPNHIHDLSLRTKLRGSRGILLKELEVLHGIRR